MIEKISHPLAIHMRPLPEGEGPSSHWKHAMELANSLEVFICRIPMVLASHRSPLALYTQIHTTPPLQTHSMDFPKSVQASNPKPSVLCNKAILHTEMRFWTRTAFRLCALPQGALGHMRIQIGWNTRARQRHNSQGSQLHSKILTHTRKMGSGTVQ